ncbi:hypothetical protein ACIRFF_08770 [Streptomyces cyaneofuscatus]
MTAELWLLSSLIGLGLAVGVLIAVGWAADHRITTHTRTSPKRGPMAELLPFLLLAVLLAAAVRCLITAITPARDTTPEPQPSRDTETRVWVACHRPRCGHMQWPHDVTSEGLRCTHCGQLNTPA